MLYQHRRNPFFLASADDCKIIRGGTIRIFIINGVADQDAARPVGEPERAQFIIDCACKTFSYLPEIRSVIAVRIIDADPVCTAGCARV